MVDSPSSIGYLTVQAAMSSLVGDSSDVGSQPDAIPADANVIFKPVGIPDNRPFVVGGDPPGLFPVEQVVCRVVGGVLYGPADGRQPATGETPAQPVSLIDPMSAGIDFVGWVWQADFTPTASTSRWKAFSITFNKATEDDGHTVNLARAALAETNLSAAQQPVTWPVAGDGTNPPSEPPGSQVGQFVLDTTTWNLYQIGA